MVCVCVCVFVGGGDLGHKEGYHHVYGVLREILREGYFQLRLLAE